MTMKFDVSKYLTSCFIESGTYHGKGIIRAIKAGFKVVYSIEVLEASKHIAENNLQSYHKDAVINLYLGDSIHILPQILENLTERATFWLDGHGGYDGAGACEKNCPLYEELDAIEKHYIKDHIIMIDDLRIIRNGAWGTHNVNEAGIMYRLKKINSDYKFFYEDGAEDRDCLVAVVPNEEST